MGTLSKNPNLYGAEGVGGFKETVGRKVEGVVAKAESASKREGSITKSIEKVTASLPSTTWLIAAGVSMLGSITLRLFNQKAAANFVGEWVPTLLLLGIYNKIVKVEGSERHDKLAGDVH